MSVLPNGVANADLPPIQMLWFGRDLSAVERLSITSFVQNGHPVHLYVYGDVGPVPPGTTVLDADDIVTESEFSSLRERGVRAGIFADYFRYTLLVLRGGWWADSDVVCLRPFDFTQTLVIGRQDERRLNNAILRIPQGHDAAKALLAGCLRPNAWRTSDTVRRMGGKTLNVLRGRRGLASARWGSTGPDLVTAVVRRLGLHSSVLDPEVFYPIPYSDYHRLFTAGELRFGPRSRAVHLWNEIRVRENLVAEPGSPVDTWMISLGVSA